MVATMFAEESLETHLLHAQEPGEIPPQEPAAAASWLGMLRPGFATAQCFRCLGKRPPSLAEHLHECRCSAPTPWMSEGSALTLSPASVSLHSNPPLNSLRDAHCPFILFPPQAFQVLSRKKKKEGNLCAQAGASHPALFKGALPNHCRSHPAKSSRTRLPLSGVAAQHRPAANALPKHQARRTIKPPNFRSGSALASSFPPGLQED